MFQSTLKIEKVHGFSSRFKLLDHLTYKDPRGVVVRVPPGFETDLATGWIRGRHDEATVVHDYLLEKGWSFKHANQVMRDAMRESGCRPLSMAWISFWTSLYGFYRDTIG